MIDANRRKTGGKLEIQLNLREPLSGEDIVRRAERWLVIDEFGQDTSSLLASSGLTPMPYQSQQSMQPPSTESPTTTTTTTTITPAPGGTPSSSEPPSTESRMQIEEKTKKPATSKEPETNAELEQAEEEYNKYVSLLFGLWHGLLIDSMQCRSHCFEYGFRTRAWNRQQCTLGQVISASKGGIDGSKAGTRHQDEYACYPGADGIT